MSKDKKMLNRVLLFLIMAVISMMSVFAYNYRGSYLATDVLDSGGTYLNGSISWTTHIFTSDSTCTGTAASKQTSTISARSGTFPVTFNYTFSANEYYVKGGTSSLNYSCFRILGNTINNTGGWNLNVTGLDIYSGRGAFNQPIVRLLPLNTTNGYTQIAFYPEGNFSRVEGDVLINVHKAAYDNSSDLHRHLSIYTSDDDDGLRKRLDLDYRKDFANVEWNYINKSIMKGNFIRFADTENAGFGQAGDVWGDVEFWLDKTSNKTFLSFDPQSNLTNGQAEVRFFRKTNMTTPLLFSIYRADNTQTTTFTINPRSGQITKMGGINMTAIELYSPTIYIRSNALLDTDTSNLHFSGRGLIQYDGVKKSLHLIGRSGKNIDFSSNDLFRMRLTDEGNFGINTTLPTSRLHVNGNFTVNDKSFLNKTIISDDFSVDNNELYFNITSNSLGISGMPRTDYSLVVGDVGENKKMRVYEIVGASDLRLFTGSSTASMIFDNSRSQIDVIGKFNTSNEAFIGGIKGDGSGKVVCIKSDGALGTCTDQPGVSGTCTCS